MEDQQIRTITRLATLVTAVSCISLLLLTFFGYGRLRVLPPRGSTISVNGHYLAEDAVWLRPGTYNVATTSPTYLTHTDTIHVHLFLPTSYTPKITKRDTASIVTSTLGSAGLYGKPKLTNTKWLNDNTWLVGIVGPGSPSLLAFHYQHHRWNVAYYEGSTSYPHNLKYLPANIVATVNSLHGAVSDD